MNMKQVLLASVLGSAFALGTAPAMADIQGKVTGVENGGRQVMIGGKTVKVSGSRTKVTINGKSGDRGEIKAGMTCKADAESAKTLDCK